MDIYRKLPLFLPPIIRSSPLAEEALLHQEVAATNCLATVLFLALLTWHLSSSNPERRPLPTTIVLQHHTHGSITPAIGNRTIPPPRSCKHHVSTIPPDTIPTHFEQLNMKLFNLLMIIGATTAATYDFISVCNHGGACEMHNCHAPLCTFISREQFLEHMAAEALCSGGETNKTEYVKCIGPDCDLIDRMRIIDLQRDAEARMSAELRHREYLDDQDPSDDCLKSGGTFSRLYSQD